MVRVAQVVWHLLSYLNGMILDFNLKLALFARLATSSYLSTNLYGSLDSHIKSSLKSNLKSSQLDKIVDAIQPRQRGVAVSSQL